MKFDGRIKREELTCAIATKLMEDWKSFCPGITLTSPFSTMLNLSKRVMEQEELRYDPDDIITLSRKWWPPRRDDSEREKLSPEDEALEYAWHKVESMTHIMRKIVSGREVDNARRAAAANTRPDI